MPEIKVSAQRSAAQHSARADRAAACIARAQRMLRSASGAPSCAGGGALCGVAHCHEGISCGAARAAMPSGLSCVR